MEEIIQQYLFANLQCPLPGLGTLKLHHTSARYDVTTKAFFPPKMELLFEKQQADSKAFINYISEQLQINIAESKQQLTQWINGFLTDNTIEKLPIAGIGNFKKDAGGHVEFTAVQVPVSMHGITAQKVIRNDAVHQVLVGDRERSSEYMTEYFSEGKKSARRFYWWIWAVVLMMVALSIIAYYGIQTNFEQGFGNQQTIAPKTPSSTYQSIP